MDPSRRFGKRGRHRPGRRTLLEHRRRVVRLAMETPADQLQWGQPVPSQGHLVLRSEDQVALRRGWLPPLELVSWRLHREPDYAATMLQQGAPAWPVPAPLPKATAGIHLWDY